MLEFLPLAISALAAFLTLLALPGMERVRQTAVLTAMGCGQIYIAAAALVAFLVIENGVRLRRMRFGLPAVICAGLIGGIVVVTLMGPGNDRTLIEFAQLALYIVILLLGLSYVHDGERLLGMLKACTFAATIVAVLALITFGLGWQAAPHVFVGRGSNEGAVFLSLIGVLPAATLFVRTRNPLYLGIALLLCYPQYLATSRGSMIVSALVLMCAAFFLFRNRLLRFGLVLLGLYITVDNLPILSSTYREQLNFSARERVALFDWGVWLWQQNPITGYGWGSTTGLAQQAPTTVLFYPHFHNTYVQMLVEAGVVGLAMIVSFLYLMIKRAIFVMTKVAQNAVSMLVVSTTIAMIVSGFFDAMFYGADRAIQMVLLAVFALRASSAALLGEPTFAPIAHPMPPLRASPKVSLS